MITNFNLFTNESVKNEVYAKHVLQELLLNIRKITSSIKNDNISIAQADRAWHLEIRWLDINAKNQITNLLKKTQIKILKSGILLYFKISERIEWDFEIDKATGKKYICCNIYLKDLYSMRYAPKGNFLYHSSSIKNRESIYNNGLMLKGFEDGNWINESGLLYYPPAIFATIDYMWSNNNKNDLWLINTENLKNKWWLDLNFYKANEINKPKEVMTFEPIPPEYLTLSNDSRYNFIK